MTPIPYLGEILSILAPFTWAIAILFFKKGGETVSPLALNLFKTCVGFFLIVITLLIIGGNPWQATPWYDFIIMTSSGIVGIAIADTIFFVGLNILGASRMSIVGCSYMPTVVILSFLFLGERFTPLKWMGAFVVFVAILITSWPQKSEGEMKHLPKKTMLIGVAAGVLSMVVMAIGVVMAKSVLDRQPVVWSSGLRLGGAAVALLIVSIIHPKRREYYSTFKPSASWKFILPGAVIGTYLAYMLWVGGMKFTMMSVASVLNQLNIIFTPVLAFLFLKEPLSQRTIFAIILALLGSISIVLG